MIRYPHDQREMGFMGPLIGLGTTIIGAIMASSEAEEAAERAEQAREAEYKRQVEAASAVYRAEMEAWQAEKEALRERREYEEEVQRSESLKRAQTFRMLAVAGALGLGVIGIGLLLR